MIFDKAPKFSLDDCVRITHPKNTIRIVTPFLDALGVTRVGDITQLDSIGIPTYISVRPKDKGPGISYYNGKGTTKLASHAGALMEALERFCGESYSGDVIYDSFENLNRNWVVVNPESIIVPLLGSYDHKQKLEWVEGYDLLTEQTTLVPLNSVICPYRPNAGKAIHFGSTNGLAAGNCIEEAVCHAICEVIERDASAIALAKLELLPAVMTILSELGATEEKSFDIDPLISTKNLPRKAALLMGKLRRAGMEVYLRNITSDIGIPTIDCTIVEGRNRAHGGTGTHPNANVALTRAITEAAQSRLAHIQGGREDLPDILKATVPKLDPKQAYGRGDFVDFTTIASYEYGCIKDDIEFLLMCLKRAGFEQVVAVNLTDAAIRIPVVRIVIPLMETWSVFTLHVGRATFGPRVRDMLSYVTRQS